MQKRSYTEDIDTPEPTDRLAIAILSALFGFLTGVIIWFAMPRAFGISYSVFLWLSVILAVLFSFIGFFSPDFASRTLGKIWDAVGVIRRHVFFWSRLIK